MQWKTNFHPGFLSGHQASIPFGLCVCGNSQALTQSCSGTWLHPSHHVPQYCNTPMLSVLYKDVPELQKSDPDFERIPVCGWSIAGMYSLGWWQRKMMFCRPSPKKLQDVQISNFSSGPSLVFYYLLNNKVYVNISIFSMIKWNAAIYCCWGVYGVTHLAF